MEKTPENSPITAIKAIRLHCLECLGNSYLEVEKCSRPKCPLWPFRFGTNPRIKPLSEDEKEKRRQNLGSFSSKRL